MRGFNKLVILLSVTISFVACSNNEEAPIEVIPLPKPEIVIPIENTLGVLKKSADVFDGYTLFISNKNTYLINNCGQVINHWISDYDRGGGVYLLDDGSILRSGKIENPDISIGGIGGIIEKFDWNGNLTWSYLYSTSKHSQHHDIYPMPNGNILMLAAEIKTEEEAILAGRNPELIENGELYTEQVIEIKPVGANDAETIWKWDVWDHLIQDFDNSKSNYGIINQNPQRLDINFVTVEGVGKKDWLHFNSMQYSSVLDQIILSSQALSEIYVIDHSTTIIEAASNSGGNSNEGGDFLYRYGNPKVYDSGTSTDQTLFGQHFAYWIPDGYLDGGKIITFNNGLGRETNFSSVDIINPPITANKTYETPATGSAFLPVNFDWSYINPVNPLDFYSRIISSAQRLPNGNTLICEGTKGHFFEIDPDFNIVWQYINPDSVNGLLSQTDKPTGNPVFRAIKYDSNHPAFKNKNLNPKDPIELNFNIGNCE